MVRFLAGSVLSAGLIAFSGMAGAAVIEDFRGADSSGAALAFNGGTVTASQGGAPATVFQTSLNGLGVNDLEVDDNGGTEQDEFLIFTFDTAVTLGDFIFGRSSGVLDSFDVFVDGVNIDVAALYGDDRIRTVSGGANGSGCVTGLGSGNDQCTIDLSLLGFGTVFAFTDGSGQSDGDDFSIAQISFSADAVPEPAGLALLGLGIAGLGFAMRRRPKAA